jgi:integrase
MDIEETRIMRYDPALGGEPIWPHTVEAFWADQACTIRSDTTRNTWGYSYRRLDRLNGGKPIVEYTPDDLVAYITQRNWDGPRWAPLTARNHRTALCSLFGWAHLVGRIPADPSALLGRLVRIRQQRARTVHWLNDAQIAALIATTDIDRLADRRDRILLMLGLLAGLRTGEISRLRWRDVDLAGGWLRFTGKGDKPATVTMPEQLRAELRAWRELMRAAFETLDEIPVVCTLAFPLGVYARSATAALTAMPVGQNGIARVVHDRGERIGVPDLRPHDLRRTLAGMLDEQGTRLQDVRLVLRHERLATTEAYLADNPRRVERRMRALTLPGQSTPHAVTLS